MPGSTFYVTLTGGKRFLTFKNVDHFTQDNVIPDGTTTPKKTSLFDGYYRDLNGAGQQVLGLNSADKVLGETIIAPGSPDTVTLITGTLNAVTETLPDDGAHIAPRQLQYGQSFYQFWGDVAGTILVGTCPVVGNYGPSNAPPNIVITP